MGRLNLRVILVSFALVGCVEYPSDVGTGEGNGPGTSASMAPYLLAVSDPVGDQSGPIDVDGMLLVFDPATGEYAVYVVATAARPFQGRFRVDINLYNCTLGPSAYPSFFSDTTNDFAPLRALTMVRLTGRDSALPKWKVGHAVFTNSIGGTGNPEGTSVFRSRVGDTEGSYLESEDVIALANPALAAQVTFCPAGGVTAAAPLSESQVRSLIGGGGGGGGGG